MKNVIIKPDEMEPVRHAVYRQGGENLQVLRPGDTLTAVSVFAATNKTCGPAEAVSHEDLHKDEAFQIQAISTFEWEGGYIPIKKEEEQ